jgi:allantoate deiminase
MEQSLSASAAAYTLDLCQRIALCTDVPGTITRLFLSPATHEVHALLRLEMESLGMTVRVDAAGNLRAIYAASEPAAPVLLVGSHVDTVPNGGAFDGILGVALPLAVIRSLNGRRLPYAVEVIAFSEEEGIRFRMPFIGSRAVIGSLGAAELARQDADGVTITRALHAFGLDEPQSAHLTPGTFAFVECHIEQGPVLEALGLALGVVTDIAGQTRYELTFTGTANHAGTTPMHLRRDALAAAASWIAAVERFAREQDGLVATVGMVRVEPGAANVIPGVATVSLDVRHAHDRRRELAAEHLLVEAERTAALRGVTVVTRETSRQDGVPMDCALTAELASAVEGATGVAHRMVSGAGHDAMILAARVPATMLFLRTPHGLSHHPDEAVIDADVALACEALRTFFERLEVQR